tara:strand:+ start:83 stop:1189 length:1107 start_codon:yes stop_codon:yes gene_type:complete
MDDLLKEAIADAKAVRETALENAKIALEEAFTPRLQSMLSKKIQSEIDVEEGAHEDEEDVDERMHDEEEDDVDEKMRLKADDEDPTDKDSNEAMHDEDEDDVEERMHGEEEDDEVEERMHDEDDDEVEEGAHEEDEDDVDEELDLESVLKELEADLDEDVEEGAHEDEEEEKVDENDVSSGIGAGDNKVDKKAGDSTDIGNADKAKFTESADELDEDIDLDEVLKALTEEDEEEVAEEVNEVEQLQSELDEHREVVKYLRGKLNEVNLLNAKLLFTNKLFRGFGLSNEQKMKVVETFDRAANLREVKLVYSTLVESFQTKKPQEIKESKGSASKAVASTKSEKQEIISEGSELRDRFKKLAGITKFNS